jgi:hypothetical protein
LGNIYNNKRMKTIDVSLEKSGLDTENPRKYLSEER